MSEDQQCAMEKPWPIAERIWVSTYCCPDEKIPSLHRLKVTLEINGEPIRDLVNEYVDGCCMSGTNLTPILEPYIEKLRVAREALEWCAMLGPNMDEGIALWDGGEKVREALAAIATTNVESEKIK